jgi:hypothetical protein
MVILLIVGISRFLWQKPFWKNGFRANNPFFFFSICGIDCKSLGTKRVLYEDDFIFDVLLQTAIERFARHSSDCQSVRFELALESLAIQISKAAPSLIFARGKFIKMILFLQNYCKLIMAYLSALAKLLIR